MVGLPEIDEMIKLIIASGTSDVDLANKIKKLEKSKPYYKFNRRLAYKAVCDELHIDLNIRYGSVSQEKGEHTSISDLTSEPSSVNLRGYILNIPKSYRNRKDTGDRINVPFADETGIVSIGINQINDDMIDRFNMEFSDFPTGAYLLGVTTGEWQGRLSVGIPTWGNWEKIGVGDYNLPEFNKIYNSFHDSKTELEEKNIYYFHGILIDITEGNGYVGCPNCRAGLQVEKGTSVACTIKSQDDGTEKGCGKQVTAFQYDSTSIMIGDEYGEVSIDFSGFSNVGIDYLNMICEADPHPEVIVQSTYSEQYGLSGRWIIPIGNVTINGGTGKRITTGTIDQLDFSKDEGREKIPRKSDGTPDDIELEYYIQTYKRFYIHLTDLTPDDLATNFKDSFGKKNEIETRPIVEELLKQELIKIKGDKISPMK